MKPGILFIGGTRRGLALMRLLMKRKERIVRAFILEEDAHEPLKVSKDLVKLCEARGIPYTVCQRLSKDDIRVSLLSKPDVAFVCGWRTLLSSQLYKKVPLGCLAAHDSLLPKYRGFAPLAWAIINGEKETGVTLFRIDDGAVDSGDTFRQKHIPIAATDTAHDVYPRIVKATLELYEEYLEALKKDAVEWIPQDESKATYGIRRTPADGNIDWSKSAEEIVNFIRALDIPNPYAWTVLKGERINVKRASVLQKPLKRKGNIPGDVLRSTNKGVVISCGRGQVIIKEFTRQKPPVKS